MRKLSLLHEREVSRPNPLEFCEKFMDDYERALPYIFGGQDRDVQEPVKREQCTRPRGRPRSRLLPAYADKSKRGFGVRTR